MKPTTYTAWWNLRCHEEKHIAQRRSTATLLPHFIPRWLHDFETASCREALNSFFVTCDTWYVSSTHCSTNKSNKSSTTSLCYVIKSQVLTPPICPTPSQDGTNTATPFPCKLKTHLLRTYLTSPAPISLPYLVYPTATSNICSCLTMIFLKHSSSLLELFFGRQVFLYYTVFA